MGQVEEGYLDRVRVDNPGTFKIRIKVPKTDQFRKGVDIYLRRTHNQLCPVEAILAYIAKQGREQGLQFRFKDGCLLTKDQLMSKVRESLSMAGVNVKLYSGHSFRIGAATTAGHKGLPSEKIQTLGRWDSTAYLLYVRLSREELSSTLKIINTS